MKLLDYAFRIMGVAIVARLLGWSRVGNVAAIVAALFFFLFILLYALSLARRKGPPVKP
jgi:uncharacterized membrane protein YtjA (UPF0391 family)